MKLPIKFYQFISNIDYFSEIHKYHKHENNEDMIIDYMISNLAFLLTPSNFHRRASYCFNNWFSILLEIDPIKYSWVKKVDLQFLNNTSVTKQQIIDWEVLNFTGKNKIFTVKREKMKFCYFKLLIFLYVGKKNPRLNCPGHI